MSNIIGNYVGGSRVNQADGALQEVFNPSTGEISGQVRLSNATDLDDTVKVASAAAIESTSPLKVPEKKMSSIKRMIFLRPTIAEIGIPLPIALPKHARSGIIPYLC